MRYWQHRLTLLIFILLLAGCSTIQPAPEVTPPPPVIITATFPPVTPTVESTPAPSPTEAPRTFVNYHHPSGVFSMTVPQDWEQLDNSTTRRLEVRMIPPAGFGSRIQINGQYEGALDTVALSARIESAIQVYYQGQSAYTEISRTELTDGQMQVVFDYQDAAGAVGTETLYIYYLEPFFITARVFLSEPDTARLNSTLQTTVTSLTIHPQAEWGTSVAALNPNELIVTNTFIWRGDDGTTYYMGEFYNASPTDIMNVSIRAGFCSEAGVVLSEATAEVLPTYIRQGASTPFAISISDLPRDVNVCTKSVTAQPANSEPAFTTNLEIGVNDLEFHQWREDLTIQGYIHNPTLSPVETIRVMFAAYNPDKQVIGYIHVGINLNGPIDPGQTVYFEIVIPEVESEPDYIYAMAQGWIVGADSSSLNPTTP